MSDHPPDDDAIRRARLIGEDSDIVLATDVPVVNWIRVNSEMYEWQSRTRFMRGTECVFELCTSYPKGYVSDGG